MRFRPLAVLAFLAAGCAPLHPVSDLVKLRAAREFRCPVEQVSVETLPGNAHRATACGNEPIYYCDHIRYFEGTEQSVLCIKEGTSFEGPGVSSPGTRSQPGAGPQPGTGPGMQQYNPHTNSIQRIPGT